MLEKSIICTLWGLGLCALSLLVAPQHHWPRLAIAIWQRYGVRPARAYTTLRVLVLIYLVAMIPYGAMLAVELTTGAMSGSRYARDWLLDHGKSISYFADRLEWPAYRAYAWATMFGLGPMLIWFFIGMGWCRRRFLARVSTMQRNRFRCAHCDYELGEFLATTVGICPECGGCVQTPVIGRFKR